MTSPRSRHTAPSPAPPIAPPVAPVAPPVAPVAPPVTPVTPLPVDFVVPTGSLENRLDAFLAWLAGVVPVEQAFVADREGLPLTDGGASPELVAAAASVSEQWADQRRTWALAAGPSIAIDLEGKDRLYLVLADSGWGHLSLGLVTPRSLTRETLNHVSTIFEQTVKEATAKEASMED